MHGATDLLVVQNAAGEPLDALVEPQAQLPEPAGSGVEVEHGLEVIFSLVGPGGDDPAPGELEGNASQLTTVAADGKAASEPPAGGVLDRTGEDLARGHVAAAVGIDPGPAGDGERQVGVLGLDVDLVDPAHDVDQAGLAASQLLPGGHRVGAVEEHGRGGECLVVVQVHAGVGGVGGGGVLGQDPAVLPRGLADRVARPVAQVGARIRTLVDDMLETMYEAKGIGLAATQVDVHERLIVIDVSEQRDQPLVLINPEIVWASPEKVLHEEGCLSVPGIYDGVERARQVRIKALDREGKTFSFEADELLAVCVQHEMDHLLGKVFVEYLSPLKRNRIKTKMLKQQREEKR